MKHALGIAMIVAVGGGAIMLAVPFANMQPEGVACALTADDLGEFVNIPGGGFVQGANARYPEEGPARKVFVSPFRLLSHEVTNSQFAAFVVATGYVTEAERGEGSASFEGSDTPDVAMSWWSFDPATTWRTPDGEGSDLKGRELHPVVHVTLNDARAYAEWAGARIPTEVEWEYAASLGLFDADDPESGMHGPKGEARANIWNGPFPVRDLGEDGFKGLAPVGCFEPGLTGAYDMIGNVWEWTESPFDKSAPRFTIKGGSFLCSDAYCQRYRAAARQSMEGDFSTAHIGFRIVKSAAMRSDEARGD